MKKEFILEAKAGLGESIAMVTGQSLLSGHSNRILQLFFHRNHNSVVYFIFYI